MNLLIFGIGYSGLAIAHEIAEQRARQGTSQGVSIAGTTRKPERFDEIRSCGAEPLIYSGGEMSDALREHLACATHVIISISPDRDGDPLLGQFAGGIRHHAPNIEWVGYLSTVGVYGDHGGAWVDEETLCKPVSARSTARLEAENGWTGLCERENIPLAIIRLSGIYGPGRNAFRNLSSGAARRLVKPGQVFNRIHVADIAGATAHLMLGRVGGIFNVTDDLPAPPQDVVAQAAQIMGVAPPPETDFSTAELSPMARSFYGENKRVSNARIKAQGYQFLYPDYRRGLEDLWQSRDSATR